VGERAILFVDSARYQVSSRSRAIAGPPLQPSQQMRWYAVSEVGNSSVVLSHAIRFGEGCALKDDNRRKWRESSGPPSGSDKAGLSNSDSNVDGGTARGAPPVSVGLRGGVRSSPLCVFAALRDPPAGTRNHACEEPSRLPADQVSRKDAKTQSYFWRMSYIIGRSVSRGLCGPLCPL